MNNVQGLFEFTCEQWGLWFPIYEKVRFWTGQ